MRFLLHHQTGHTLSPIDQFDTRKEAEDHLHRSLGVAPRAQAVAYPDSPFRHSVEFSKAGNTFRYSFGDQTYFIYEP